MSGDEPSPEDPPIVRPLPPGNPKGMPRPGEAGPGRGPTWVLDADASSEVRGDAEPLLEVDPSGGRDLEQLGGTESFVVAANPKGGARGRHDFAEFDGLEHPVLPGNPKGGPGGRRNMAIIVCVIVGLVVLGAVLVHNGWIPR